MGGTSAYDDIREVKCVVMFPSESGCNPVGVDGGHLNGEGVNLVKKIGKTYLGEKKFGAIHERSDGTYVSICTDDALRGALRNISDVPGETFILCLVYINKARGSIEIRVNDRCRSPEPVVQERILMETASTEAVAEAVAQATVAEVILQAEAKVSNMAEVKADEEDKAPMIQDIPQVAADQGDYVVLQTPKDAESAPTFFISSSWHLQADRMSASLSTSCSDISSNGVGGNDLYVVVDSEL